MVKILSYAKPYKSMIFVSILLLFAQANLDLALPDYLSQIVDTGIQQGGIDSAVPIAYRESEMQKALIFLTPANRSNVLNSFTLISENSSDYTDYLDQYPVLQNESIYIRNDLSKSEMSDLSSIMGRAVFTVYMIEQIQKNETEINTADMDLGINLELLPPGMDLFSFLALLPEENLSQIVSGINQNFSLLSESMITQAAAIALKAEYEAIGMDTAQIQNRYILRSGAVMLFFTLLSVLCTIAVGYMASKTSAGIARDLRKDVFENIEHFSNAEFDQFSTASLITRTGNDITQIQTVSFMIVRMVFYAPILGFGGVFRIIGRGTNMWWIIGIAVLLLISLIAIVFTIALPKFKIIQKLIDHLNLVSRENLSGIMVIRAFNMQDFEEKRFDVANNNLTKVSLFINRVMVIMMPLMMLIMNGLSIAIIWAGSHQVRDQQMQVGDMMAYLQYSMQIVMAFLMMSMMFIMIPRAAISAKRVKEVLNTELSINDSPTPVTFSQEFNGEIQFENVCFRYPNAEMDALCNISFVAKPGETTAIIGPTGSGKSTMMNLIPRFYDVTEGTIKIDGHDIREVTQQDLRDKIGFIPQTSSLFSGTIESNLRYANENASDEVINSAISMAQATEIIAEKTEGLQSAIAQGGSNVSGGQKQRLSIARALVKNAPIYVFDDSFSALDFKTDSAVRQALKQNIANSTILIVTQRVSTIMGAEQILVLDDGQIVGKGTHAELLEKCPTYREIAQSQLELQEGI